MKYRIGVQLFICSGVHIFLSVVGIGLTSGLRSLLQSMPRSEACYGQVFFSGYAGPFRVLLVSTMVV